MILKGIFVVFEDLPTIVSA